MSTTTANPLFAHPVFAPLAAEISSGNMGQLLSLYLSARTRRRDLDPLTDLGSPLLDFLLSILKTPVVSVLATNERILGPSPDAWFVTIRFADDFVATLDLGTFLPDGYPVETEVRLEVCGTERAIVVEPDKVAVTVIGRDGTRRDDAYAFPWDESLRLYAQLVGSGQMASPATDVIATARRSASTNAIVTL